MSAATADTVMPALSGSEAMALVSAAADIALLMDNDGVIQLVRVSGEDQFPASVNTWVGQTWSEAVTVESRVKVQAMLRDAGQPDLLHWRHINFPSANGADIPLLCSAVQIGPQRQIVALGRDLRPTAALQQRLVDAQQSMERDYVRLRHLETRYRVLFEMATEAVLMVDAGTLRVSEANPAASQLVGDSVKRIVGRPLNECFAEDSRGALEGLLNAVRAAGRPDATRARLAGGQWELDVAASMFRQESGSHFLVRLSPVQADAPAVTPNAQDSMASQALENAPDGFVMTDPDGLVMHVNQAFLELTQVPERQQLIGESLDRWLGRSGVDLRVLIANLRQRGSVRMFATTLRGFNGSTSQVEISGVSVPHGETPCLGFMVRDIGRRLTEQPRGSRELPRSVAQLTELVGRVPLKRIVSETTDLIEQLCIEAALELTQDNRASASEMLGLSRQSLYVKLRRFGMSDAGGGEDNETP